LISEQKKKGEFLDKYTLLIEEDLKVEDGGHTRKLLDAAELIVISPGVPLDIPVLKEARKIGIPIIGELELAYQQLRGNPIIAITGSNGKTTTTTLIGQIFKDAKKDIALSGNIGVPLSQLVKEIRDEIIMIVEVSSFQLETIEYFRPNISVFLNITPDHLDRYSSFEDYKNAKKMIFKNQNEDDFAILNYDDPAVIELSQDISAFKIYFSTKQVLEEGIFLRGNEVVVRFKGEEIFLIDKRMIKIPGNHNLENAMAASMVALLLGIEPHLIAETLSRFNGVEHRLELIAQVGSIRFINDSKATNVDSMLKALESFEPPIVLIAGGRDKGGNFARLKDIVSEKVEAVILLGEASDKIAKQLKGCKAKIIKVSKLMEAVKRAYELIPKTGYILFSPGCASYDMFENFEQRGRAFKNAVKELIRSLN
jgi:UDP-N-acetylmuramoylalanine--D-glutamate ligase